MDEATLRLAIGLFFLGIALVTIAIALVLTEADARAASNGAANHERIR